ncbi:hypothetical protein Tco_0003098 [Tanacetum coccineum]
MEALIEDENAIDKGVADTVKDHKRKHVDDEDLPAGPNQGKKTKRRRTKESESSKKQSSTKDTPKVKEPITEVVIDDAGDDVVHDDDQTQDTSKLKTRKTLNPNWFKQPLRPPTPDPEWNKRQVVLDQPCSFFKYLQFELPEDVVNLFSNYSSATILQIFLASFHISNIDHMYIKSYGFRLFSSLPAINGFDMPLPVAVCSRLVNPLAPRKGKFHGGLMTMSTLST